jgi:hypothetical protein
MAHFARSFPKRDKKHYRTKQARSLIHFSNGPSNRRHGSTPLAAAGLPPASKTPNWWASSVWAVDELLCGHQPNRPFESRF